jgi:hypothetical protein
MNTLRLSGETQQDINLSERNNVIEPKMACVEQQGDFKSLSVSDWSCLEAEEGIATHEASASPCEIVCKAANRPCKTEEYIPVNFIDDEIRAMILGWQTREITRLDAELEMPTSMCNDVDFEPARPAPVPEPPKKFIRSLSRRNKLASEKLPFTPTAC